MDWKTKKKMYNECGYEKTIIGRFIRRYYISRKKCFKFNYYNEWICKDCEKLPKCINQEKR